MHGELMVIAEIGQAHDGSLGTAHAYIDAVADTGCQAVKFQTHYAAEESSPEEPWRVKFSPQDATRYDYWHRMEFTPQQWIDIGRHCHDRGLNFISSPFSLKAVEVLKAADIDVWKVASGEISNILLLREIAKTGQPVYLSSGMSGSAEIERAVDIFKSSGNELLLLQCTTSYPVSPERVGLNVLMEFADHFEVPVGLSDHSGTIFPGLAAFALGASAVEVHVTFSRQMYGPDVSASITLKELRMLVEGADWIKKMQDNPVDKDAMISEFGELRSTFMQSFAARVDIAQGKIISIDDVVLKKPCIGIPADEADQLIGRRAVQDIKKGTFLQDSMISD